MKLYRTVTAFMLASTAMSTTAVFAQTVADDAQQTESAEDSAAEVSAIAEITVTAQKRSQNLQDVPVSITALSGDDIARFGFDSASDIQFQTPGLIVSYSSTSAIPNFSIRGVGLNDFTAVQSSPVAIHVDDVYFGSSTLLNFALFDVDRVEVLKGPQGTLYGRNSTGGAVNFFTHKPTQDSEGGISVELANYQSVTAEGFVSGPLTDTLSGRVSLYYNNQGSGPFKHPTIGRVGKKEKFAGRAQLLWNPSDKLDVRLVMFGGTDDSDGNQYQGLGTIAADGSGLCAPVAQGVLDSGQSQCFSLPPTTPGLLPVQSNDDDPFTLQGGIINRDKIDVFGATLAVNYDFGDVAFSSITGYAHADRKSQEDADGTILRAIDVGYETKYEQLSEELRLASSGTHKLDWTLGAFLSTDRLETPRTETDLSDIFDGFRQNHAYELETTSFAIFSHNEYHLTDAFSAIGGIRYTHEKRSFRGGTINVASGVGPTANGDFVPSPTPVPDFNNVAGFDQAYINDSITFDKVSWRVGLNYHSSDTTLLYGSVSNGFKSGGFVGDITVQSVLENPYDEETLTAYEIGLKSELFDRTVRWNTSAFYYDYKDVILAVDVLQSSTLNTLFTNDNVSDAKVYGIETDILWQPAVGWEIGLAGTYMDSKQEQTVPVVQAIDGSKLPYAPKWSGNASVKYETHLSDRLVGAVQLDGVARSGYFAEAESVPIARLDGYALLNASINLSPVKGNWSIDAWVKNLADKQYFVYLNDLKGLGAVIRTPGLPRTFGIKFSYKW